MAVVDLPSQHSSSSSVAAVVHLHVIKLTHILSLQAEVPEAQRDDVTLLHSQIPNAQLVENRRTPDQGKMSGNSQVGVVQIVPAGGGNSWGGLDLTGNRMARSSAHHIL